MTATWVLIAVLAIAFIGGAIAITSRINKLDPTRELTAFDYQVGALDTTTGKEKKDDYGLVSNKIDYDKFESIKVTNKNDVQINGVYVVAYNKRGELVAATKYTDLNQDNLLTEEQIKSVKYIRIYIDTEDQASGIRNKVVENVKVTVER